MEKKNHLTKILCLNIFLILIFLAINISLVSATWWNDSYSYKQEIKIQENNGSNLNNYSVQMNITYNSNMNPDFSDIRFINGSENGELGYYIEGYVASTSALVWVYIPNLTASVNTSIYMYYKNTTPVSTTSDMTKAFIFGDDFLTDTSANYWMNGTATTWTFNTTNGTLKVLRTPGGWGWIMLIPKEEYQKLNTSYILETKYMRSTTRNWNSGIFVFRTVLASAESTTGYAGYLGDIGTMLDLTKNGNTNMVKQTAFVFAGLNYYIQDFWAIGNGTLRLAVYNTSNTGNTQLVFTNVDEGSYKTGYYMSMGFINGLNEEYVIIDWTRVRHYVKTIPTYAFGAEESQELPKSVLISPLNNTYTSNLTVDFTANLSGPNNLTNGTLYIEGPMNITNTTIYSGVNQSILTVPVTLTEGIYNWFVQLFDILGNSATSLTNKLIIDTTNPQIEFVFPTLLNGANASQTFIFVNVSVNETNEANITFKLYNNYTFIDCYQESADIFNQTGIDGDCGLNYSGVYGQQGGNSSMIDGNWNTYGITGYNMYLNINYTKPSLSIGSIWRVKDILEERNLTIPNYCWNAYPDKINLLQTSSGFSCYWSCNNGTDYNTIIVFPCGSPFIYEEAMIWNTTSLVNSTVLGPGNRTINWTNLSNGHYLYQVIDIDLAGNINSTELRKITLDTLAPNITQIYPAVESHINQSTINFTWAVNDSLSGIKNTTVYISTGDTAINLVGNVPANYSIYLTIPYNPSMNANYSDIRFHDNLDNPLPYWIESSNSTEALVWVMIQNNDTFYLSYGNSSAISQSNFTGAFLFADDFKTDTTLNYIENNAAYGDFVINTANEGIMTQVCTVPYTTGVYIVYPNFSLLPINTSYIYETSMKHVALGNFKIGIVGFMTPPGTSSSYLLDNYLWDPSYRLLEFLDLYSSSSLGSSTFISATNVYYMYRETLIGNNTLKGSIHNITSGQAYISYTADDSSATSGYIGLYIIGVTGSNMTNVIDWIRYRPYAEGINYTIGGSSISIIQTKNSSELSDIFNIIVGIPITLIDGIYDWFVTVFDFAGNSATSSTRNFTLDTIYPKIEYVSPTLLNNTYINQTWIFANVSVIEVNEANISFNLYGNNRLCYQESFNITNQSGTDGNCGLNYTGTSYLESPVQWISYSNIYDGDWGTYGRNAAGYLLSFYINYTKPVDATNLSLWTAKIHNGTIINMSLTSCFNAYTDKLVLKYSGTASGGQHYYYSCYNGASWIDLYDSGYTPYSTIIYEEAIIWNIPFFNLTTLGPGNRTFNWTGLSDGNYLYQVIDIDLAGNVNSTDMRSIRLDTNSPNAVLLTPTNGTYSSNLSQNFTVYLTDNLGIKNATLFIYNQTGLYNETPYADFTVDIIQSTIIGTDVILAANDDTYNWFYQVWDWAGNTFTSQNNTLIIDKTVPIFSNKWDDSNNLTNFGIGHFNITVENTNGSVILNINSQNVTATNLTNNIYNASYTFITNGTYPYTWISYGNGTGHNLNTSAIYSYLIGNVSINLLYPPNNTILLRTNNVTLNMSLSGDTNHNWTVTFYNATNYTTVNTTIGIVTDVTTTVGAVISLVNITYGQVFKWFVSITDGISTFVSNIFEFTPNNEPNLLNLRIENINLTTIQVFWENEPDMDWVAFRIGNDIIEVRSITSTADNWTVTGLFPNQQYILEYQTGDSLHAISDYHGFYFRTLGWHPGFADYPYRRLISANHTLVGIDKKNYAVNVSLNEDNFQYFDGVNWVWYPSFLHLNYTTLNDIRFVDYYDIVELPFNVTYKNIPGIGGLSYQTIPNFNSTTGIIIDVDKAHDGSWTTNAVPNTYGSFYYNYTIPIGAKTTSMFRISDSGWGWDIQLPLDCYGAAGTDIAFRSDANRTGIGAGYVLTYCQSSVNSTWLLARNNTDAGPYFFETMMTWQYDSQVNIEVIPRYFNDELQDNTAGIDGEYNSQFWMYYGDADAINNESVLAYTGLDNNPLIYGDEVGQELLTPTIFYLNDTEGRTATGTNISWSVNQIVNNRLRITTNPYLLETYFYTYITNTTQYEHSLIGTETHTILTLTSPSEYMNIVNVTCSNSSYDANYTVNSTADPVEIIIPNLNTIEFLSWNFTYTENKTWWRQVANVVWPVTNLTTNTQYWYEAIAYGTNGNGTANGTFILGTLPSTPTIIIYNYSENRPTKTVKICADLTNLNGNPTINVSFQYWNQTDISFKETSLSTVTSTGTVCKDITVAFGELNSYRAKAVGTTTGYSSSYTNEIMPIQEFFAGSTIEDNNDAPLYRQYCPTNPDGTVNINTTCYEQKGYREGSLQEETTMYVETNASTDTLTLHLILLNGTNVSNTIMSSSVYGFKYLTLNNLGQNWYTFYITNSTSGIILNWTKPGMTHRANQNRIDVSKYVSFNGTTSPFNYTLLYFNNPGVYNTSVYQWCQAAPGGNLFDCMSAQYWGTTGNSLSGTAYDRGQFFRGGVTNGELADSGILNYVKNNSAPLGDYRQCFAFTVFYFDESLIPNNNITNYHYVYWQENQHFSTFNGKIEPTTFDYTYLFNFEYDTFTFTRDWKAYSGTTAINRTIVKTVANNVFNSSYNQSLIVGGKDGFNIELKDDKQYDFGLYNEGNWINQQMGKYQQAYIIFNLPDNATLNILDSDTDGLSDFEEVYTYYTNPKSNDTDEDGMADGAEITGGYDPLLFNSHTAPNITLINPGNNSFHNTNQNFTANITTVTGISSVRLYINNVLTDTYNTVGTVTSMTIGFVKILSDGVYSWFYGTTDTTGINSNSTIYNVTIDKTLPGIIIIYPLNITYNITPTDLNYTFTEINPAFCWYSTDNGITNNTLTCGDNVTGLTSYEGSNTWMIRMQDNATNINQTYVTFYVDTIKPNINFTSPTETSGSYINRTNIQINITAGDTNLMNISIKVYNSSFTEVGSSAWTDVTNNSFWYNFIGSDGIYYFNATATDFIGNARSTETRNTTIDMIYPTILYTNPTTNAGGPYGLTAIWSNMTAVDANLFLISSTLELINGTIPFYLNTQNLSPTLFPNDSLYYNWTALSQGIYRISGYAIDRVGHITYIINRSINIDTESPIINYTFPTPIDGFHISQIYFTINVTASDPNFANQTIYYWYETGVVQTQTTAQLINTLLQNNLIDGIYYYNASAVDSASRTTWLPTRSVVIEYRNHNVSVCKELFVPDANYFIQADLTSATTCLNVTAPGITIYCQGHIITGNDAILATKMGLTLKDCIVTSPLQAALRIRGNSPASVTIYNSTFTGSIYGINVAPEANVFADLITLTSNDYGIYFNDSNDGNILKNVLMSGNTQGLTIINSSYNSITNLSITSGGGTYFTTSTDNNFNGCIITPIGTMWTLSDYSINNNLFSCYYTASESVDGTSQLIRSWPFTGSVLDKALNKMQNAIILFRASIATNMNVSYKDSSSPNISYGTLGGVTSTNSLGLGYTNITQYMNIFGTTYSSTPYYFNASYGPFTPTIALLNMNESATSRYHQFILGDEIASSSMSRIAMWLILGIIFLIGIAASIGFFIVRMREGYSVVDIWKYFIILVIWLTIFTVIYFVLAWFIMGSFYPKI